MATLQKDGLMIGKDTAGNPVIIYPITTMDNVDGLAEALAASKPVIQLSTISASKWNKTAKTYSFESTWQSASYDIEIEPNSTCTEEQLAAYAAAMVVGSSDSNVIKAYGDIPQIDIPIIVKVVSK